jgi:tripartite-type tricarboxylate transporter receptor subunit TctC
VLPELAVAKAEAANAAHLVAGAVETFLAHVSWIVFRRCRHRGPAMKNRQREFCKSGLANDEGVQPPRSLGRRKVLHLAVAAIALPALNRIARAQAWPTRPLTMIVPFPPGGTTDTVARILAPPVSELLGQSVIVENVGGAGGMTGTARVAKAAPDGYQFVLGDNGTFAINQAAYKRPPYNAATDFAPVCLVAELPLLLITRKDLPVGNLQEFIAHTKANQARMQYGSPGVATGPHLGCVMLNAVIGVDVTHIPYRGGAPAIQDLIAGRIDYQCPIITTALPQIEGDRVRVIATLSRDRSSVLPKLASAQEQGVDVDANIWLAFFLPKGAPTPIVRRLHDAVAAAIDSPAVQARMREIGADLVARERRSPEYLQTFVESEIRKWTGPIKASGVLID